MSFVCQVWGGVRRAFLGSFFLVFMGLVILTMSVLTLYETSGAYEGGATGSGVTKIEYYLPYPGILPDSVWYKFKALRDRISLWITFDEEKKADKELLYANKRIGAAKVLVEGGKLALGVSTATKAEKYLERVYLRLETLTKQGKDVKSDLLELKKAILKHKEILEEIVVSVSGFDKGMVEEALKLNNLLEQKANQIWLEVD